MKRSLTWLLLGGGVLAAAVFARRVVRQARWFSYHGKKVIIAGGSRGLGLVLARQLISAGADVAICARTEVDLHAAKRELEQICGRRQEVLAIRCDISSADEAREMVENVARTWGRVDVLINVAGIIQVGPLDSMTLDDFYEAMQTNCWGHLHTILAVLPYMRRQGMGRIVNVASIGGKQAVPHLLPYVTSKFALVGLSKGLRTELIRDGVLVTTACPTLMRTGSPRNAQFKGQNRKEYAWFSAGGSLPFVSVSAERAAQQILTSAQYGEAEVLIANLANPPARLHQLFPRATACVLSWANLLLPAMGGIGRRAAWGYDSESRMAPSILTARGDRAALKNNEMQPRRPE